MDKHGQAIEPHNVFLGLYTVLFLNFRLFRGLNRAAAISNVHHAVDQTSNTSA